MERPFQAYEGDEPYVFVCYGHDDQPLVYPEITRLKESGFNIWYDEGIAPGSEWSDVLAQCIENCALFLYFVTPNSAASEHCRHEINYALEEKRPILAVHLEETELPRGLRLTLNARQAIRRYEHPQDVYKAKLSRAVDEGLANDLEDPKALSTPNLGGWVEATAESPASVPQPQTRSRLTLWTAGAVVVLIAAVAISVWWSRREAHHADATVVVNVQPFENQTGRADLELLVQGLDAELVHNFAQVPHLDVRTDPALPSTRNTYILAGTLRRSGKGVRLTARVGQGGRTIWSRHYESPIEDALTFQIAHARKLSHAMLVLTSPARQRWVQKSANEDARLAMLRVMTLAEIDDAALLPEIHTLLDQALRLDPDFAFALAFKALALQTSTRQSQLDPRESVPEMRRLAERALNLEPDLPLALSAKALLDLYDGQYASAEATIQRNLAAEASWQGVISEYYADCGRFEEALAVQDDIVRAFPFGYRALRYKAMYLAYAHRFREATAIFDDILAEVPDDAARILKAFYVHMGLGRYEEAARVFGFPAETRTREDVGRGFLQVAAECEDERCSWQSYVWAYALLGEFDEALRWMERGWELGDRWEFFGLRVSPWEAIAELREAPGFKALMERTIGDPRTCPGYVATARVRARSGSDVAGIR